MNTRPYKSLLVVLLVLSLPSYLGIIDFGRDIFDVQDIYIDKLLLSLGTTLGVVASIVYWSVIPNQRNNQKENKKVLLSQAFLLGSICWLSLTSVLSLNMPLTFIIPLSWFTLIMSLITLFRTTEMESTSKNQSKENNLSNEQSENWKNQNEPK